MALADIPSSGQGRRLDSWKEIAEYLGRDVRTATRWEAQGMPLHRVPGGKGSSVFAFTNDIDAWMAGRTSDAEPLPAAPVPVSSTDASAPTSRRRLALAGIGTLAILTTAGLAAGIWSTPPVDPSIRVSATPLEITVAAGAASPRAIHRFDSAAGATLVSRTPARVGDLDADGQPDILAAVSYYERPGDRSVHRGELLHLSPSGDMRWRFAFDDVLRVGDSTVAGPWALSDWQAGPRGARPRIAVAAHDFVWWSSLLAIVDSKGARQSTFFNPGWIESVLWLDENRVAFGGFNNPRNEAMAAILDANNADGQGPGTAGTPFNCLNCASAAPLFYATLPRSELNLLTASRFNRAHISVVTGRMVAMTTELEGTTSAAATAIYEFDVDARTVRARYSEGYWDAHRRLELEGRLTHSRENCPERDGPAAIHVWSRSGWQRIAASR